MSDEWEVIKKALENPKYKWRTVDGMVKETRLDKEAIVSSLSTHHDKVLTSSLPTAGGDALYTTKLHYKKKAFWWEKVANSIKNRVE